MTAYRERMLNGDYEPKNVTISLDGREVAKTIERSRKRKTTTKAKKKTS